MRAVLLAVCILATVAVPAISQTASFRMHPLFKFESGLGFYEVPQFSPTGKYVLTIIPGRKLIVWETVDQKKLYELPGKFTRAIFSPDEKLLAATTTNDLVILDSRSGENLTPHPTRNSEVRLLTWAPDSSRFATANRHFLVDIVSVATGASLHQLKIHNDKAAFLKRLNDNASHSSITAIFTPDGRSVLTNCEDSTSELWDVQTGRFIFSFTQKPTRTGVNGIPKPTPITQTDISPDGRWIVTQNYENTRVWETATGRMVREFDGFVSPQFSADGRYLGLFDSSRGGRSTELFDLKNLKEITALPNYHGRLLAWSPDGASFITDRTYDEVNEQKVFIWATDTGNQKASIDTYTKYCFDWVSTCISDADRFAYAPDSKILMVGNKKRLKFLSADNGSLLSEYVDARVPAKWSPDGKFVLAADVEKGKFALWSVDSK